MNQYFIKYVMTYRQFTKSAKGQKVMNLVSGLEHILLRDVQSVVQLYQSLSYQIDKLNARYPKTSRWSVVLSSGNTHLYIRPLQNGNRFGDDYVAMITIVKVEAVCDSERIHRMIKYKADQNLQQKGGEK